MKRFILIVDGNKEDRVSLKAALAQKGTTITLSASGKDAVSKLTKRKYDVVFCCKHLPDMDGLSLIEIEKQKYPGTDFILVEDGGNVESAVEAIERGASNYLPKPVVPEALQRIVARNFERRELKDEVQYLKGRLQERYGIDSIIARSSAMEDVFKKIRAVGKTDSTVLICGETGVGKELVANVIHLQSKRSTKRFLAINCGALPDTLLESELFGYEKGAFTGADSRRIGRFETASGGTMFLDEISTISQAMQIRLLRVLQERKITRLGSDEDISIDVRIISATNKDLKSLISEDLFREDLFYRVNVFPITIPPLRDRKDDIVLLAGYFLKKYRSEMKKNITEISSEAVDVLRNYDWPGNVRELENIIERATILEETNSLKLESFPPEITEREPVVAIYDESLPLEEARQQVINYFEKEYFVKLLDRYKGRIGKVAKHAGLSARSIHMKMQKYDLHKEDFKHRL